MLFIALICGANWPCISSPGKNIFSTGLAETGQLSISELVAELQVSADTIRRDLSDLEQQGVLQKKPRRGHRP